MRAEQLWGEYVTWLGEHLPAAHDNLADGATDRQLDDVRRVVGRDLPDEVLAVWRRNDGQRVTALADNSAVVTPCLPTLSFLSTSDVIAIWRGWDGLRRRSSPVELAELSSLATSTPPGVIRPAYTLPGWIPLWADPFRPDYIGLDLDPGPAGIPGQIINFGRNEDQHRRCAADLTDLLTFLLAEVRSGAWPATVAEPDLPGDLPDPDTDPVWFGDSDDHFFNALYRRADDGG